LLGARRCSNGFAKPYDVVIEWVSRCAKMIPALEAILVEALEPRQNRKRGDDLAAVEYLQREDPEIQRRRVKAVIDEALSKA